MSPQFKGERLRQNWNDWPELKWGIKVIQEFINSKGCVFYPHWFWSLLSKFGLNQVVTQRGASGMLLSLRLCFRGEIVVCHFWQNTVKERALCMSMTTKPQGTEELGALLLVWIMDPQGWRPGPILALQPSVIRLREASWPAKLKLSPASSARVHRRVDATAEDANWSLSRNHLTCGSYCLRFWCIMTWTNSNGTDVTVR